jgi:hypothetical protein
MKALLSTLSFLIILTYSQANSSNFPNQTIDLGVVVSDIEKSLHFYKNVLGFQEKEGFKVAGKFPKLVGLTDGANLEIHVLKLGDEKTATKLKLCKLMVRRKLGFSIRVIFTQSPGIHTLLFLLMMLKRLSKMPQSMAIKHMPKALKYYLQDYLRMFAYSC